MACGLREDGVPRLATMQRFWLVWEECRRRLEWSRSEDANGFARKWEKR